MIGEWSNFFYSLRGVSGRSRRLLLTHCISVQESKTSISMIYNPMIDFDSHLVAVLNPKPSGCNRVIDDDRIYNSNSSISQTFNELWPEFTRATYYHNPSHHRHDQNPHTHPPNYPICSINHPPNTASPTSPSSSTAPPNHANTSRPATSARHRPRTTNS